MGALLLLSGALLLLLIVVFVAFLLFCGYIYYTHLKYDHIPGPPRESFFMGHAPTLIKMMNNNEIIYDPFFEWIEKYGPIIRLNGMHKVMVWVISPEGVKEFLLSPKYTKDDFYERLHFMFGSRFMGRGLLTDTDYSHWHKQRRLMDPAFSKSYLIGSMQTFNEKAEEMVEKLSEMADWKQQIKMHEMFGKVTMDVIAKIAFAMDLNSIWDEKVKFPQIITKIMQGMLVARDFLARFDPFKINFIREVKNNLHYLRKQGKERILQRIKAIKDGDETPKDILTQILKSSELQDSCTLEDLVDNFVTFFIAGQETTANQLSFALMELGRYPEVLAKVQAEVDEVIGSKRDIEYEDLKKLQYLTQVLKETLRLYPTVPGTSRLSVEEIVIDGVRIPAGSNVMFNTYIMCRMEKYFKDPLLFDPDRFHPDAPKPNANVYFPFSLGPRTCIGQAFSQMEAKVVMVKFLQRFEFELVEGQSFKCFDNATLRPLDGVLCRMRPRTDRKPAKK
ncbi:cholesterol 24-hydroxylase-like isoform 1-T1 [Anomaloglossus baeobatrachus]|uniref:cholesterol 24-hydroxylase-like n=1 Tax=Anomaloglossus baeobatrachus TaxID=238106 RepID=UPI003F4FBDC7